MFFNILGKLFNRGSVEDKKDVLEVRVVATNFGTGDDLLVLTQVTNNGDGTYKLSKSIECLCGVENIESLTSLIIAKPDNYTAFGLSKSALLKQAALPILQMSDSGYFY